MSLLLWAASGVAAQVGQWEALLALREVNALLAADGRVWAAVKGGVFGYDPETGAFERYTRVEGLSGSNPTALAYDAPRDALWIGYPDGTLDRLGLASGGVQGYLDIARATQFPDRTIHRLRLLGDTLYAMTAFGVVAFDPVRGEVRDSYTRLGPLRAGVAAHDLLAAPRPDGTPGLWVATDGGVVHAARSGNLREPGAWTLDTGSPPNVRALAAFDDTFFAGTASDVYERNPAGGWSRTFLTGEAVPNLLVADDHLWIPANFFLFVRNRDGVTGSRQSLNPNFFALRHLAAGPGGSVWLGDAVGGVLRLPATPFADAGTLTPLAEVAPEGPRNNQIIMADLGPDGSLWTAHRAVAGQTFAGRRTPEGTWEAHTFPAPATPTLSVPSFLSGYVDRSGRYWGGLDGDGVVLRTSEGVVTVFDERNSTLVPAVPPSYTVAKGIAEDSRRNVWVLSPFSSLPVHRYSADDVWTGLRFPSSIPASVAPQKIVIDAFDQLWIQFEREAGFVGWNPGSDLASTTDDRVVYLQGQGSAGVGLPNAGVRALAVDRDGQLWIGTARGLGVVFSVGSALSGDATLAQPQWARTPEGGLFLRDLTINEITVDPANNKWLASTSGVWVINSEGNTVLQTFTTENSPLLSDNVLDVDFDARTGRVYLLTEAGLMRYQSEVVAAAASVQALDVAPNPYRPAQHPDGVLISGLVADTDLRILTVDGQVVATLTARGGSVRWDGRDQRTGQTVGTGVYVVAASGAEGNGPAFGKVAVLR